MKTVFMIVVIVAAYYVLAMMDQQVQRNIERKTEQSTRITA